MQSETEKIVAMLFCCMYYQSDVWNNGRTTWLGVPIYQTPMDMVLAQEAIWWVKPDVIIETGSLYGGTAWFFASLLEKMNKKSRIISIDIEKEMMPQVANHPQITFINGSSVDPKVINKVKGMIKKKDKVMVFLDSDHSTDHVLQELKLYSPLVTSQSYIVVHDTFLGGNPIVLTVMKGDKGPMEAVNLFLKGNNEFNIDHARGKFFLTFCPNGWLLRR